MVDIAMVSYSRWMIVALYSVAAVFGATAAVLAGFGIVTPSWLLVGGTTVPAVSATYLWISGTPKDRGER